MALNATQQIFEQIKNSRSVLVTFKEDCNGDAISSALALAKILKHLDKKVNIVCHNFKPATNISFLGLNDIKSELESLQKFVISIDTSKTQIGEFYYDNENNKLNIYVTPKNGQFKPDNVSTKVANYEYDLIFIINSPDLESLGDVYKNNSDFFYATPKINIDNLSNNEYFGDINIVNLASSSTSEIIYAIINNFDENLIDENVATFLLCGIINATKNFKISTVSPNTLNTAAILITKGARREQIIQNLYQTRFLSTLKIWGRVLSRLNNDLDDRLVWSTIANQDFLETATSYDEIPDIIDELIISMPKIEVIILIYERREFNDIECLVYTTKNLNSNYITSKFNSNGNDEIAKFNLNQISLAEAERIIINEIRQKIT